MASPLYGQMGINAIVFGVQGNIQRRLKNPDNILSHGIAGSIAGIAQSCICSPMELAKTRMQMQGLGGIEGHKKRMGVQVQYTGPVDCLRKIYRAEGARGLSKGYIPTVMREGPSFFVYFASYKGLCDLLQSAGEGGELGTSGLLIAGGFAGMLTWASTYPIDVIKSRFQADTTGKYKGVIDCFFKSYKELGMGVFHRGLGATLTRAFPTNAATFAVQTQCLRWMMGYLEEEKRKEEEDGYFSMPVVTAETKTVSAAETKTVAVVDSKTTAVPMVDSPFVGTKIL